ncbi:MAG TPA: large conductance mechanosensitive channel protein MscL [Ktedonobacteraceae bacterium]|nr:large conductance mechanosensitive channel protein MscL [Ktedonobacteraceae bacterium]
MAIWNNQTVSGVEQRTKKTLGGFKAFILRGNVVDLAVGIMIGAAFTAVVNGLVGDIITPLIPLPTGSLATLVWHPPYNPKATVNVGAFIITLITFLILAFVIYFFIVEPMNAFTKRYKPKDAEAPPTTRDCPYCLNSVPLMATRCGFCTSPLPPPQQQPAPMQNQPAQRG